MKKIARLTDLEIKIMKVLWAHEKSLTIQEIGHELKGEGLSVPSVSQAMKHLIEKKAVKVDEFVLVTSKYARTFSPCFTKEAYLAAEFERLQKFVFGTEKVNLSGIAAALLNNRQSEENVIEEIDEIKDIIEKKREQLKKEESL